VLKYHGGMHKYIESKMDFLDISSLGAVYQYAIKIEQNIKQKTWKFGPVNSSHQKKVKGSPNPQKKGQNKYGNHQDNQSRPQEKKETGKRKKDNMKWFDLHKIPWHNTVDYRSKQSLVDEVKAFESDVGSKYESEPERGRWIIDMEPSATVATTKVQPNELNEPE
jgi:hypothetical protein